MNVDGFELSLQDFCSYCPNFEPEVEKIDVTSFGEATRYMNNIRCENSVNAPELRKIWRT